jgi:hypothetical protein
MSPIWVLLVYGSSVAIAVALIYYFHPQAWYWHGLSIAAALTLGLVPLQGFWNGPGFDLSVGFVFTLLFLWGLGGLAAPLTTHHPHLR